MGGIGASSDNSFVVHDVDTAPAKQLISCCSIISDTALQEDSDIIVSI